MSSLLHQTGFDTYTIQVPKGHNVQVTISNPLTASMQQLTLDDTGPRPESCRPRSQRQPSQRADSVIRARRARFSTNGAHTSHLQDRPMPPRPNQPEYPYDDDDEGGEEQRTYPMTQEELDEDLDRFMHPL